MEKGDDEFKASIDPDKKTRFSKIKKPLIYGLSIFIVVALLFVGTMMIFSNQKGEGLSGLITSIDSVVGNDNPNVNEISPNDEQKKSNVPVESELILDNFKFVIDKPDIVINAEEIIISSNQQEIIIMPDDEIQLRRFKGAMVLDSDGFYLSGDLLSYLSNSIKINWKNTEDVRLKIYDGEIELENINIPEFESHASGQTIFKKKIIVPAESELVNMKGYVGSIKIIVKDGITTVFLNGEVDTYSLDSEEIRLDID